MKASRLLIAALNITLGLGLCTVTANAFAQSDSSAVNAQDKDADASTTQPATQPAAPTTTAAQPAASEAQPAMPETTGSQSTAPNAPAAQQATATQSAAPEAPAAQSAPRAYYDSSSDRTYYKDQNGASVNDANAGARSGASSSDEQGSEYVAPQKEASPRVHDMNRPTKVDSPSNTNAPAVGHETDARPQGPLNGLLVDAGLGAGFGMHAPGAVWGLGSEYVFAFQGMPDRLAFKGLFDVNFGYGSDLTQFLSIGIGANWFLGDFVGTEKNRAHVGVDVSAGDATNAVTGHCVTSAVLGAGMNYTFLHTNQADFEAIVHYAILLQKLDNSMPSLLTFRVGMSF